MADLLPNPIWRSLSTLHLYLARGNHLAKRYPEDIAPLAGIPEQSAECWEALTAVVPPGDHCVLFLNEPADLGGRLKLVTQFPIEQMLCESPRSLSSTSVEIEELSEKDVHQMMSLAALTEPGPFRRRTIQLGGYVGIRDGGRLVAMAGLRTAIPGYREVSAVCTNPSYRGRGYAATLVCSVMNEMAKHGELPYLHVRQDNISAIRLYSRLGFRSTRTLYCTIVTHS
jgi:ribosomal protein S18 acetylase RimI-like enzyme